MRINREVVDRELLKLGMIKKYLSKTWPSVLNEPETPVEIDDIAKRLATKLTHTENVDDAAKLITEIIKFATSFYNAPVIDPSCVYGAGFKYGYHNWNHTMQACDKYLLIVNTKKPMDILKGFLALLFHDSGHTQCVFSEDVNISSAIFYIRIFHDAYFNEVNGMGGTVRQLISLIYDEKHIPTRTHDGIFRNIIDEIISIVSYTKYPYTYPTPNMSPIVGFVRDADLLSSIGPMWYYDIFEGLFTELLLAGKTVSLNAFIEGQVNFVTGLRNLYSETATSISDKFFYTEGSGRLAIIEDLVLAVNSIDF